ncbi:hypothetical protein [Blautia pseudococcoides]
MFNPDHVFTYEQLHEQVWDEEYFQRTFLRRPIVVIPFHFF